jgi:hypothetical protein
LKNIFTLRIGKTKQTKILNYESEVFILKKFTAMRVLSIFLALVMLLGLIPIIRVQEASAAQPIEGENGDVITFGSYPQSQVKAYDAEGNYDEQTAGLLIAIAFGSVDFEWTSYNYYSGGTGGEDGSQTSGDWMMYHDIEIDGSKYRVVKFTQYRQWETCIKGTEGCSMMDNNGYTISESAGAGLYVFKFEPIKWRIIDADRGLVLCETAIDAQPYNNMLNQGYKDLANRIYANNYAESDIREWLNDDFYNTAFSTGEKARIIPTEIENKNPQRKYRQYDCENTEDNVFLLSYDDVQNTDYGFISDSSRVAKISDYAGCQGAFVSEIDGSCSWLLRSPSYEADNIYTVHYGDGKLNEIEQTDRTDMGIRPAMRIMQSDYDDLSNFEFGTYPQSEVKDEATKQALTALLTEDKWISYGYYSGDTSIYSGSGDKTGMQSGDWMKYADITYNGDKYRAVKFTDYRPLLTGGKKGEAEGSFQDDNGYYENTVYFFKFEPLEWRVLDDATGLVVCEDVIDSQAFCNVVYVQYIAKYNEDMVYSDSELTTLACEWDTSSIRKWLNEDFYNTAFNDTEKAAILKTKLDNTADMKKSYDYRNWTFDKIVKGNSTQDNIFLLSMSDVKNTTYFPDGPNGSLVCKAYSSDYAACQGVRIDHSDNEYHCDGVYWLLRNTEQTDYYLSIYSVDTNGGDSNYNSIYFSSACSGIRPAMCVSVAKRSSNYVYFGSYPQSEVTASSDSATYAKLEAAEKNWFSGVNNRKYADITVNGGKYRAMDYNGAVSYFEYEPIKWRVLDYNTGLVVSEQIIDAQQYNNTIYSKRVSETSDGYEYKVTSYYIDSSCTISASQYDASSIRTWLNEDFYTTAFSLNERNHIIGTTLETEGVTDKVFLLSVEDALNTYYGFKNNETGVPWITYASSDANRIASWTAYAKAHGDDCSDTYYLRTSSQYWKDVGGSAGEIYKYVGTGYVHSVFTSKGTMYCGDYTYLPYGTRPAMCIYDLSDATKKTISVNITGGGKVSTDGVNYKSSVTTGVHYGATISSALKFDITDNLEITEIKINGTKTDKTLDDILKTEVTENTTYDITCRDTVAPVITGITDKTTYSTCGSVSFTVTDNISVFKVTANGTEIKGKDGTYTLASGLGNVTVIAYDGDGNTATCSIVLPVIAHTPEKDDGDCTTKLICSKCGTTVTEAEKSHDFTGDWINDANNHWHACKNSGCTVMETRTAHKDGDKNHVCDNCGYCSMGAHADADYDHKCDYGCGGTFGECKDDNKDHYCDYGCGKYFGEHIDTNSDHYCDYGCGGQITDCEDKDLNHYCDNGCGKYFGEHIDANFDHNCDYGCSEAIGNCEDKNLDHKCDYGCGKEFGEHADKDDDHNCDYCGQEISKHSGGTATCNEFAKCTVCGKTYGDKDIDNHVNLKQFPEKAATADEEGNIEYWYCDGCKKYFSDENGTNEIEQENIVIKKLEPDDSDDDSSGGVRMFYWLKWLLEFLNKLMTKMFNILGWAC